ncbi:MAG: hypothetical protein JXC36_08595 [Candidatus Atribacteria bacterium]|nr:hypothetical protein [Candidatus Atribacteria bacterium]MBN2747021.1 hypothetical protein [Bacteroidales bacterium]
MLKIFIKILIASIIIGTITIAGVFIFIVFSGEKEVVELTNDFNGERIFLIKKSWGINDSKIVIGLDDNVGIGYNSCEDKYVLTTGSDFIFYKLEEGKLYVYNNDFKSPESNKFQTKIEFINLSNPEFYNLWDNKNYKKQRIMKFPE